MNDSFYINQTTGVWIMSGHSKWANIKHKKEKRDRIEPKFVQKDTFFVINLA